MILNILCAIALVVCPYSKCMDANFKPNVVILVGATRSGKSTISRMLEKDLQDQGIAVQRVNLDDIDSWVSRKDYEKLVDAAGETIDRQLKNSTFFKQITTDLKHVTQNKDEIERIEKGSYQFYSPLHTLIEKAFQNSQNKIWIFDYVNQSRLARQELGDLIRRYRKECLLVKVVCSEKSALDRLHKLNKKIEDRKKEIHEMNVSDKKKQELIEQALILDGGARQEITFNRHYRNPQLYNLADQKYDLEFDTSMVSVEDYKKIVKQIETNIDLTTTQEIFC